MTLPYLLNVRREQLEYPDLRKAASEEYQHHRPSAIFVEDKANGRVLVQDLRRANLPVRPTRPEGSKEARADAATPVFEAGRVLLPANAPWLQDWIDEHLAFPSGAHDDQVDTTSEAIKQLTAMTDQPLGQIPIEVHSGVGPQDGGCPDSRGT